MTVANLDRILLPGIHSATIGEVDVGDTPESWRQAMAIHLSERVIESVANGDQMPNIFVVTLSKEGDSQTYEYVRIDLTDHGTKVREEARQKFDLPPIDEGAEWAQQQAEALQSREQVDAAILSFESTLAHIETLCKPEAGFDAIDAAILQEMSLQSASTVDKVGSMVCFGALSSPTQELGLSVRAIEQLLPSQEAMNRLKDLVVYVAKTRDLANYVLDNELARIDIDCQEGRWEEDVQLMVNAYMLGLAMRRWHDVTLNRREGLTRQLRVAYVDEVYGQ